MSENPVVVLDIETVGNTPTPEEEERFQEEWSAPSTWKDLKKINTKRAKDFHRWKTKRALTLDGARVVSVAICSLTDSTIFDMDSICSNNEESIAKFFAEYMNDMGATCKVVGFKHLTFDLPILNRILHTYKQRLKYPFGKWDGVDLIHTPYNHGLTLKNLAQAYGISRDPEVSDVHGEDVAKLFSEQSFDLIEKYNREDVRITAELYIAIKRMWNI